MPKRKGSISSRDDSPAECPFSIQTQSLTLPRKRQSASHWKTQYWPFKHAESTPNSHALDVRYLIAKGWQSMHRRDSFFRDGEKISEGDFVYVANEKSLKRPRSSLNLPHSSQSNDWVARILEIRGLDDEDVYLRVFWMYWPYDLPSPGKGRKSLPGSQPYYGKYELIVSNHMDIIDAASITKVAKVDYWVNSNHENSTSFLYWRQTFNYIKYELTPSRPVCNCGASDNPDEILIFCKKHGDWMHGGCLRRNTLMRVLERSFKAAAPDVRKLNNVKAEEEEGKTPPIPRILNIHGLEDTVKTLIPFPPTVSFPILRRDKRKHEPYHGLFDGALMLVDGVVALHVKCLDEQLKGCDKEWYEEVVCLFCEDSIALED